MNKKTMDFERLRIKLLESIDRITELLNYCKQESPVLKDIDSSLSQLSRLIYSLRSQFYMLEKNVICKDFQFENFIEGNCNKLARSHAISIAEGSHPNIFSPFFIFGSVGSGKTHLMHAIVNKVKSKNHEAATLYLPSEYFCEMTVNSIRNNLFSEFIAYLSEQDILLIDDIHCLAGKEKTQDVLVQVIDILLSRDRQVVFSASVLPKEITPINDRLLSRISNGLTVTLGMADSQTLERILNEKAQHFNMRLPDSMLRELLSVEYKNIREAEGHFFSLIAKTSQLE